VWFVSAEICDARAVVPVVLELISLHKGNGSFVEVVCNLLHVFSLRKGTRCEIWETWLPVAHVLLCAGFARKSDAKDMGVCRDCVLQSLISMADAHLKDVPILTSVLNIIQPLIEVTGSDDSCVRWHALLQHVTKPALV
jgi:hypothetical protein